MPYTVDEEEWEYRDPTYILLNKPPGYECSQKPSAWPSVLDLLPDPFRGACDISILGVHVRTRSRSKRLLDMHTPTKLLAERKVQTVGRLDVDTTG
jgi:16S rRNA U516 pseudouridylate synthase RsuA-like enzyme